MPHILLFGAGGIGAVYIYMFQKAGATVTAVCRSNYDAVIGGGFTMFSAKFGNQKFKPDHVVRTPEEAETDPGIPAVDFVVVCSKCFPGSTPSTADIIKPAIGRETAIVLIQNGIDIEKEVASAFPQNPLLSCVAYLPVTQTSPGVIQNPEVLNHLEIGTYPSTAPASHKEAASCLSSLVNAGGGDAKILDDVQPARWSKLLVNATWNPVSALSLSTDADFLNSSPEAAQLARNVMLEVVAIAEAAGIKGIDPALAEWQLERSMKRAAAGKGVEPSMLQDVKNGRLFELEAIVGNTVRIAREKKVNVPCLETVYALAKGLYESVRKKNGT